ncbi:MAG: SIS domain-containing protein [Candidatus Thermoplasmatota archaeon]|nr:SIS domain-containing protein [Candidatus Thermoplasmatota archaeon]
MNKSSVFLPSVTYIQQKIKDVLKQVSLDKVNKVKELFFQSNHIFVYGAGRSGLVAKAFAIRLIHLGFQAFVIGETITVPVQKGDLVIIVSGSGETIPAVMTAEIAYDLGASVVSITGKKGSDIAKYATVTLFISANCDEEERKRFAPLGTLFEASVWILLDGLVADLLENKHETEEIMRKRHATLEQ